MVTWISGAQDVLELLRLICLFEIIEEEDKNTLTYPEPVPWTSGSERVAWKMRLDMLAGSEFGVTVKAKHKAYNL